MSARTSRMAGSEGTALGRALVPVIARVLEVGAGRPELRDWVRAEAGGPIPRPSVGPEDVRLIRDLAERLAERLRPSGFLATVADQHGQSVRAEGARL